MLYLSNNVLNFAAASCQISNFYYMRKGTVKFFNETKGFGFITDNSSNEEIFTHISGLIDNIREGDQVSFETTEGKKGINATSVRLAD